MKFSAVYNVANGNVSSSSITVNLPFRPKYVKVKYFNAFCTGGVPFYIICPQILTYNDYFLVIQNASYCTVNQKFQLVEGLPSSFTMNFLFYARDNGSLALGATGNVGLLLEFSDE